MTATEEIVKPETCHMKLRKNPYRDFLHEYTCSECGETMCKHTFFGKSEPPRWCPNCGRKVVED
jgi:rubrerythrin